MSDRIYLFVVGVCILIALYIESNVIIYTLVIIMFLEGISGFTIPRLSQQLRKVQLDPGLLLYDKAPKFDFEAFRMLRISLAVVMLASYVTVHEYRIDVLWFFPWFIGFAVLGAGVSGVCPVYLAMRWLGFK